MDVTAYHLQARAPFHFGQRGVGLEATAAYGPSDTLFSALCDTLRQQFGLDTLQEFLGGYPSPDPPLVLSSAFPYALARREAVGERVGGWKMPETFDPDQAIRFFPRPLEPPPGLPDEAEERKRVKKIAWLSEEVFRAWVQDDQVTLKKAWLKEPVSGGQKFKYPNLVQGGKVWLTTDERERVSGWRDEEITSSRMTDAIRLWTVGDVPRVTVDRQANASTIYQAGRVWFQPGGGLWLLMRWRADWQERGETALQVLGDAGVGGERSAGHGLFQPHGPHTLAPLPDPMPGGRFVTLSLYYPTKDEVSAVLGREDASYRLQMRRGWMASPDEYLDEKNEVKQGRALRRKAVRFFNQGSILGWPQSGTVQGQLAQVTPDVFKAHTVWRYGLTYAVGYREMGGAA